jgi:hypothetical protein
MVTTVNILKEIRRIHLTEESLTDVSSVKRDPLIQEILVELDRNFHSAPRSEQLDFINSQIEIYPERSWLYFHRAIIFSNYLFDSDSESVDFGDDYDVEADLQTCIRLNPLFGEALYLQAKLIEAEIIEGEMSDVIFCYKAAINLCKRISAFCLSQLQRIDREYFYIEGQYVKID